MSHVPLIYQSPQKLLMVVAVVHSLCHRIAVETQVEKDREKHRRSESFLTPTKQAQAFRYCQRF